jgi:hypothetical protein
MNYEVTYRDLAKAVDRHRFLCKELGFRFSEMAISGQWNCMGTLETFDHLAIIGFDEETAYDDRDIYEPAGEIEIHVAYQSPCE